MALPAEAATEGDERWEAVQRAAVGICRIIENRLWKPREAEPELDPGYASSPALKVPKVEPGQAARSEMTRVQILHLATTLGTEPAGLSQELETLARSRYVLVRWFATQARLALAYGTGARADFIDALLAFDEAMADLSAKRQRLSPLEPDDGPEPGLRSHRSAGSACWPPASFALARILLLT